MQYCFNKMLHKTPAVCKMNAMDPWNVDGDVLLCYMNKKQAQYFFFSFICNKVY
jgi:hypothetical protein